MCNYVTHVHHKSNVVILTNFVCVGNELETTVPLFVDITQEPQ